MELDVVEEDSSDYIAVLLVCSLVMVVAVIYKENHSRRGVSTGNATPESNQIRW